jgi:hypothetical protein
MSLDHPPHAMAPNAADTQAGDFVIWSHASFCSVALPIQVSRGAWHRKTGDASVRIEPGSIEDMVPSGSILRLSMIHICDAAFRANSQLVELGKDRALLARITWQN